MPRKKKTPVPQKKKATKKTPIKKVSLKDGSYLDSQLDVSSIELDFATNTDDSDTENERKHQGQAKLKSLNAKRLTFHQCARYNDVKGLEQLLSEGKLSVNIQDNNGMSPLHYAARYNHIEAVTLLLNSGNADPMIKDHDNATPLHYVARKRQLGESKETEKLVKLLANHADTNSRDKYLSTPLHFSAVRGNVVVARALLKCRNILVNAKDALGCTPLHDAATYGHADVAELLIDYGVRILQTDAEGCTALHLAAMAGHVDIIQLLISKADSRLRHQMINMTDNDQMAALHYAVESRSVECVRLLLKYNALPNAPCRLKSSGSSPLHLAAVEDVPDIGRLLISVGADVTARDNNHATPLHLAAEFMAVGMIKVLLSNVNINIEARDNEDYTPLLCAVCYPCTEIVKLLLQEGALSDITEQNEKNVLHLAVEWKQKDVLKVLLNNLKERGMLYEMIDEHDKYGWTPLHKAAHVGNLNTFQILLNNGADMSKKNEDEETPMLRAVIGGHIKLVKELLEKNERVINDEDEHSNSALHLASQFGHLHVVKLLCEHGADTAIRNSNHKTPVDIAAEEGYRTIVEFFIHEGAAVESEDTEMETPLHLASLNGCHEVVTLLLEKGADICRPNRNDQTCIEIAISKGHRSVVEAIMKSWKWKEALLHETKYGDGKPRQTPLRLLITKMPDMAHTALSNFLEINCLDEALDESFLRCSLTLLDDTFTDYSQELAITKAAVTEETKATLKEPYTRDSTWIKENHPLVKMVRTKQTVLLHHPLVLALIRQKWRIAQKFYILFLLYYIVFLAAHTSVMLKTSAPHKEGNCFEVEEDVSHNSLTILVYVLAGIGLTVEVFQFFMMPLTYLTVPTNYLDMFCYGSSIITVTSSNCYQESEKWKWELAAFTVLFIWLNFFLFLRRVPSLGIYVVMLTEIMKTFLRMVIIFALFIVAFGLSLYMLLEPQEPFSSPGKSIMKAFIMMLGELEYTSIFFPEEEESLPYSAMTYVIFTLFIIIMAIILMNLLVGLAVEDVSELKRNAMLRTLGMQINLALDVEINLPRKIQKLLKLNPTSFDIPLMEPSNGLTKLYTSSVNVIDGELLSVKNISERAKIVIEENDIEVKQEGNCNCATQIQKLSSRIDALMSRIEC